MTRTSTLTRSRLAEVYLYDPESGLFTRNFPTARSSAGSVAGTVRPDGYIGITVDGVLHLAHRLAWLYVTGSHPANVLDHINEIRSDNRMCNLRDVSRAENYQNMSRPHAGSSSGYLGVSWHSASKKWKAEICVERRRYNLGLFDDPQVAHQAYLRAKADLHPLSNKETQRAE